jgi:CRP/FNR family cyclic AMP-dependent transcriptional regulator
MATETDVLRTVPLFAGLTERALDGIAGLARETSFAAGTTIVREGDSGDSFIVIVTGGAMVEQGGREIRSLGRGDFLGEIALIDGRPRTATVTATEPVDALVVDRTAFERLMDDYPVVRLGLVSALTQRLRQQAPSLSD